MDNHNQINFYEANKMLL